MLSYKFHSIQATGSAYCFVCLTITQKVSCYTRNALTPTWLLCMPDLGGCWNMQDKKASTPDLELVGHTDTAAFALGMCTSEPLVASGGKDTNVSSSSAMYHAVCAPIDRTYSSTFVVSCSCQLLHETQASNLSLRCHDAITCSCSS